MRRSHRSPFAGAGLALVLLFAASACNPQKVLDRRRLHAVEKGLLRTVYLKGLKPEELSLAERMAFYKVPGVGVCAFDRGEVEWAKAFGKSDSRANDALTTETVFQAGALAQLMTAAAVYKLAEAGTLGLDDDVRPLLKTWEFPSDYQPSAGRLTWRALLTHSAGLSDQVLGGYGSEDSLPGLPQILSGMKSAKNAPVWSPPGGKSGQKARLSDLGYALVQQALEDATGESFPALTKRILLDPLGLARTAFSPDPPDLLAENAASGHSREGSPIPGRWFRYPALAAKGLWTTPSDYAAFLLELMRDALGKPGRLLSARSARSLLSPQVENFGCGFLAEGAGDDISYHAWGKTEGFAGGFVLYPAKEQGIVILTNSGNGDILMEEILAACAKAFPWPQFHPVEKDVLRLTPDTYKEFVGHYEVNPGYALDVGWEDYYLVIRPTGQAATKFYAEGQTLFYSTDPYIRIQFYKDKAGAVTSLVLWQKDFELEAKRVR